MNAETEPQHEEHCLAGEQLLQKVRELVHEGNIRHLILKDEHGRTLVEVPLTLGVAGVLLAPAWAALGAVAALVTHVTLVVVRDPEAAPVAEKSEAGAGDRPSSNP